MRTAVEILVFVALYLLAGYRNANAIEDDYGYLDAEGRRLFTLTWGITALEELWDEIRGGLG